MAENQNTTTGSESTKGKRGAPRKLTEKDRAAKKIFGSEADARAAKPDANWRLFVIRKPDGTVLGWNWADNIHGSALNVVRSLGFSIAAVDKGLATPDSVASALANLTEEQRAAIIAQYTKKTGRK